MDYSEVTTNTITFIVTFGIVPSLIIVVVKYWRIIRSMQKAIETQGHSIALLEAKLKGKKK